MEEQYMQLADSDSELSIDELEKAETFVDMIKLGIPFNFISPELENELKEMSSKQAFNLNENKKSANQEEEIEIPLMNLINRALESNKSEEMLIKDLNQEQLKYTNKEVDKLTIRQFLPINCTLLQQIKDFCFSPFDEKVLLPQMDKSFAILAQLGRTQSQLDFQKKDLLDLEFHRDIYLFEITLLTDISKQFIEVSLLTKIKDVLIELQKAQATVTTVLESNEDYQRIQQEKAKRQQEDKDKNEKAAEDQNDGNVKNASDDEADDANGVDQSQTTGGDMMNKFSSIFKTKTKTKKSTLTKDKTKTFTLRGRKQQNDEEEDDDQPAKPGKQMRIAKNLRGSVNEPDQEPLQKEESGDEYREMEEDDDFVEVDEEELEEFGTISKQEYNKRLERHKARGGDKKQKVKPAIQREDIIENEGTMTKRLGIPKHCKYNFLQEKRLFVTQIAHDFEETFKQDEFDFYSMLTMNQVVIPAKPVGEREHIKLEDPQEIKAYVQKHSHNYNRIEKITLVGLGGESQIFRLKVFQPVEIVVKTPLPPKANEKVSYQNIMMESHMVKLLANPEYIAEIVEEIIEYDKSTEEVVNYTVIVEKAINDLSEIIKTWQDPKKSKVNQEEFSEEKLAYFCLKTMEAMHYCHQNNVYYGDMKPQNLLIFRDMSVKLGDFGISIKLNIKGKVKGSPPLDPTGEEFMKQEMELKGLTQDYTLPDMMNRFKDDSSYKFKYQDLFKNDYYSLKVTFEKIYAQFKDQIQSDSIFYWMIKDLNELDIKNRTLEQLLQKWRSIVSYDKQFILTLCDQILGEEKVQAVPNILKLSKYRNIFLDIQTYFRDKEFTDLKYLKEKQFQELDENFTQYEKNQNKVAVYDPFETIYIKEKLMLDDEKTNIKFIQSIITDIEPYLQRLCQYEGALDPNDYNEFYYYHFSPCYGISSPFFKDKEKLTKENFNECPKNLLRKVFSNQKEEFRRFATFVINTRTSVDYQFQLLLLTMIKLSVEFEMKELEFELIYIYNLTPFKTKTEKILKNKFDFAFRSKELCQILSLPFDKAIQCTLFAIIFQKEVKGFIYSYEIKYELQKIQQIPNFKNYKKKSFYSLYYSVMADAKDIEDLLKKKSKLLKKERKLYAKVYGEQGDQMIDNGFQLYQCFKQRKKQEIEMRKKGITTVKGNQEKLELQKSDSKKQTGNKPEVDLVEKYHNKSRYYLSKIINYSTNLEKRVLYIGFLLKDEPTEEEKMTAYDQLYQADELMSAITIFNEPNVTREVKAQFKEIIKQLLNLDTFEKYYDLFFKDHKSFYSQKLKAILKMKGKEFDEIYDLYNVWASHQYQKFFSTYTIDPASIKKEFDRASLEKYFRGKGLNIDINEDFSDVTIKDKERLIGRIIIKIKNDKLSGQGICQYEDKRQYYGGLKKGLLNGRGNLYWENHPIFNYYEGMFEQDQFNGIGKLVYSNKDVFEGEFKEGFITGKGVIIYSDGSKYDGNWFQNKKKGWGVQTYANSGIFEGEWLNDKRHGKGKYTIKTETEYEVYDGNWQNDMKQGQGQQIDREGGVYNGNWDQGKRNGKGTYIRKSDNLKYTGDWKDDYWEGNGIKFENGEEKKGKFFQNKRIQNQSDKVFENGDIYQGFITLGNNLIGEGVLKMKNGYSYEGTFVNNQQNGKGILTMPNGDKFEGTFVKNMKQGFGLYTFASGLKRNVEYYKDMQVFYKEINNDTMLYEGSFCNGKKHGFGVFYDKVAQTKYAGSFLNDLMDGEGKLIFLVTGDKYDGQFLKGLKHGTGKYSKKNGDFYLGSYEKDSYNGRGLLSRLHKSGKYKKIYEGEFLEGVYHGFGILKAKDSEHRGQFFQGKKHGIGKTQNNFRPEIEKYLEEFEGEYVMGQRTGKGKLIEIEPKGKFAHKKLHPITEYNEKIYQGDLKEGKKHGIGRLFINSQIYYVGEFQNDKRHGYGIKTSAKSYIYKGYFNANKMSGEGWLSEFGKYEYKGNFKKDLKSGNGKITYANGDSYQGSFSKGEISGYGILKYADGSIYRGQFENGKKDGDGILETETFKFDGKFTKNDFLEGTKTFKNNDVYQGQFKGKEMHDENGKYIYSTGEIFTGQFVENKRAKKGQLQYLNGDVYTGELLQNNMRHGEGVLAYEDGTVYTGKFINNLKEGSGGVMSFGQEILYQGDYKNDKKHGKGTECLKTQDGSLIFKYTGRFYCDLMLGEGELEVLSKNGKSQKHPLNIEFNVDKKLLVNKDQEVLDENVHQFFDIINSKIEFKEQQVKDSDDSQYSGQMLNLIKYGTGKLTLANGDFYNGPFFEDQMHGDRGIYISSSGIIYKGSFRNGEKQGEGIVIYPNGDSYIGKFKNGFRHSEGLYKTAENQELEGIFKNDSLVDGGQYEFYDALQGKRKMYFIKQEDALYLRDNKNKLHLPSKINFKIQREKGAITTIEYESGETYSGEFKMFEKKKLKHGQGTLKYSDGSMFVGIFKSDLKITGRLIKPNGKIIEGEYENEEFKENVTIQYPDGGVYKGGFNNNNRNGHGVMEFPNQDIYEGIFFNDQMTSEGIMKYAKGETYTGEFKDGKKNGRGVYTFVNGDVFDGIFKLDKFKKGNYIKSQDGTGNDLLSAIQYKIKQGVEARKDQRQKTPLKGQKQGNHSIPTLKKQLKGRAIIPNLITPNMPPLQEIQESQEEGEEIKVETLARRDSEKIYISTETLQKDIKIKSIPLSGQSTSFGENKFLKDEKYKNEDVIGGVVLESQPETENYEQEVSDYDFDDSQESEDERSIQNSKASKMMGLKDQSKLQRSQKSKMMSQRQKKMSQVHQLQRLQQLTEDSLPFVSSGQILHLGVSEKFKDQFSQIDLVEKVTSKQTLVFLDKDLEPHLAKFDTSKEDLMKVIIKKYSKFYRQLDLQLQFLAKGGENYVCKSNNHNIVVIISKSASPQNFIEALGTIQTKRLLESNFVTEVKESIIIYDQQSKCVNLLFEISEIAQQDLKRYNQIDKSEKPDSIRAIFYAFQIISSCYYFHNRNIAFCEYNAPNVLLLKNYQVKFGDFGISVKMSDSLEDKYVPKGIGADGYSSPQYLKAYSSQEPLSKKELFENDFYGLRMLLSQLILHIEDPEVKKTIKQLVEDTSSFKKNFQLWEEAIAKDSDFHTKILDLAISEQNTPAENFIEWCISKKFKLAQDNYSDYLTPLTKSTLFLNLFNVASIQQGFLNILCDKLNSNFSAIAKSIKQHINIIWNNKSASLSYKDFDELEKTVERALKFKSRKSGENLARFDWDHFKNLMKSGPVISEVLIVILEKKSEISHYFALMQVAQLEKSTIKEDLKLLMGMAIDTFEAQMSLIQEANLEEHIQSYTHNNQINSYDKIIEFQSRSSDFQTTEEVENIIFKVARNSKMQLPIISPYIDGSLENYSTFSEKISISLFLSELIKLKDKQKLLLKGEVIKSQLEEFNQQVYFQKLRDYLKNYLINKMKHEEVSQSQDENRSIMASLSFLGQLILITSAVPMISESNHFFTQKKYAKANDLVLKYIERNSVNLQAAFKLLSGNQNYNKLLGIFEHAKMSHANEFRFMKQLKDIYIEHMQNAFMALVLKEQIEKMHQKNEKTDDQKAQNLKALMKKMKESLKQVLEFDLENENQNNEEPSGENYFYECPTGFVIQESQLRNDLQEIAKFYFTPDPVLKDINMIKIQYLLLEGVIKAIKTTYLIDETIVETSWNGIKEVTKDLQPYVETISLNDDFITSIDVQRNFHIGIKIETSKQNKIYMGNYVDDENEKEVKVVGKVLWFETGFMPVDVDYPDFSDQELFHFGYYWTDQ